MTFDLLMAPGAPTARNWMTERPRAAAPACAPGTHAALDALAAVAAARPDGIVAASAAASF
jgi:hypothetical protein